jgi:hypothetical protein
LAGSFHTKIGLRDHLERIAGFEPAGAGLESQFVIDGSVSGATQHKSGQGSGVNGVFSFTVK